jgi:hypothetical protein
MMIESPKFQGLSMCKVNAQPKLGDLFLDLELFAGSLSSPLARLNILVPLFSHPTSES